MLCRPLSSVDFAAFTSAFNLAYSDYFMPISMTVPAFRALIERDDLSMEGSVVTVDDTGLIVGMGLLGIRGQKGWIGGMGVIPAYRRQGIGRQMMLYLLEQARQRQLNDVYLEVIEKNGGAYALYKQLGFVDLRYLLVLERQPMPVSAGDAAYKIQDEYAGHILDHFETFHSTANSWQRELPSLEAMSSQIDGWIASKDGQPAAYALGWASEYGIRLVDLAAAPDGDRTGAALALLAHLHGAHPSAHGSFYNVTDDDPVLPAVQTVGYTTALRQIEMRRTIEK